jgi:hypothetical protein
MSDAWTELDSIIRHQGDYAEVEREVRQHLEVTDGLFFPFTLNLISAEIIIFEYLFFVVLLFYVLS